MPNHLDIIREACIAANEDILKLEFGCRFLWKEHDEESEEEYGATFENWKTKHTWVRALGPLGQQCIIARSNITKILGRPIRLSDVLLAIGFHAHLVVTTEGEFVEIYDLVTGGKTVDSKDIRWNLRNDDLTAQSPETLAFISNLLSPEGDKEKGDE